MVAQCQRITENTGAFSMNNPFSYDSALNNEILNILSVTNKVKYIVELLSKLQLDLLCITETWLFQSYTDITEVALPRTHALLYVPRPSWANGRGGGVDQIYSLASSNNRLSPAGLKVSSFNIWKW